ncbi:MAG: helix-turn-helix domain-containing protein [bacterium]|nr:helix-turn-helix domain-containing protein [bacterium]
MNIPELLNSFGLSETEVLVYLRALVRDGWSAGDLARETALKRPTVYHALETLEKKGLIFFVGHKRAGHFRAESPEQIVALLSREKSRLVSLEKKLMKALPFFPTNEGITNVASEVTCYHGFEGLKNLLEKVYTGKNKTLLSIMPSFRVVEQNADEEYMHHYLDERTKLGITTKSIWQDLPTNKEFITHTKFLRSVRMAPPSMRGKSNAMIDIFDQYVVMTVPLPELFGVMIKSFEYSEFMKAMWQTLWEISEPV